MVSIDTAFIAFLFIVSTGICTAIGISIYVLLGVVQEWKDDWGL